MPTFKYVIAIMIVIKHEERDNIINAQTHNKKVFYQMIRKQRNNRNVIIDDLFVGNNNHVGDNILKGWHEIVFNGIFDVIIPYVQFQFILSILSG
jgi:hypothetical protein